MGNTQQFETFAKRRKTKVHMFLNKGEKTQFILQRRQIIICFGNEKDQRRDMKDHNGLLKTFTYRKYIYIHISNRN